MPIRMPIVRRMFLRRRVSPLSMSEISRELKSTHWRIEITHQPRRLITRELTINEELEANFLALHDSGRQEDEQFLFRYGLGFLLEKPS